MYKSFRSNSKVDHYSCLRQTGYLVFYAKGASKIVRKEWLAESRSPMFSWWPNSSAILSASPTVEYIKKWGSPSVDFTSQDKDHLISVVILIQDLAAYFSLLTQPVTKKADRHHRLQSFASRSGRVLELVVEHRISSVYPSVPEQVRARKRRHTAARVAATGSC